MDLDDLPTEDGIYVPDEGDWVAAPDDAPRIDATLPSETPLRAFCNVIQGIGLAAEQAALHRSAPDYLLCQELQMKLMQENPEATKAAMEEYGEHVIVLDKQGMTQTELLDALGIDTSDLEMDGTDESDDSGPVDIDIE